MANPVDLGSARLRQLQAPLDHGPAIDLRITGVIREGSKRVTPVSECDGLRVGDRLLGSYVAIAGHRGRARLLVLPATRGCAGPSPKLPDRDDDHDHDDTCEPSGTWELDTSHMRPRGYTLSLRILERSLVGPTRCYGSVALDFCLQPRCHASRCGESGLHVAPLASARPSRWH